MKRRSLQTKLQEIAKVGALRTYTRDEAMGYFRDGFRDYPEDIQKHIHETRDAYDRGLILCSYKPYQESDIPQEVSQFTTDLAAFILNVVYPFAFGS